MNKIIEFTAIALGVFTAATAIAASPASAEVHSKSKELVILEPRDLPEQAQTSGNSLFLHSDDAGTTYLYIEQQQGARLSIFDVTDPASIKLVVSTPLATGGVFDFVRPLSEDSELVSFRESNKEGVLDLHKAKKPVLHLITTIAGLASAENLGQGGLLASNLTYGDARAIARDYHILDIASAIPTQLATIKDVKHRVTNDDTGTTFLLGSEGLTVVRRLSVENQYKIHQMQMQGN